MEISQKRVDLSINTPNYNRDLRTVERDVQQHMDEKEALNSEISELTTELAQLNKTYKDLMDQVGSNIF